MIRLWQLAWKLIRPLFFLLEPEQAHTVAMRLFSISASLPGASFVLDRLLRVQHPALRTEVAGLSLPNPVGLAAGFDKNAQYFSHLHHLGFGSIEVGTLTEHEQGGNPQPRIFRLPKDSALINRLGFNNRGSANAALAFARNTPDRSSGLVLGINIGKSKITPNEDAVQDYLTSFDRLHAFADYITINVSSPNTKGLRDLQETDALRALLGAIIERNNNTGVHNTHGAKRRPVFVKIAPDLTDEQAEEIVELAVELGLDGIIATNTTIAREPLSEDPTRIQEIGAGGLSGAPLTHKSRQFVARLFRVANGRLPIIGVGGIMNGDDAWDMICAGAAAVQIYTGFIYGGPTIVRDINVRLLERLQAAGMSSIGEAVGTRNAELAI